MTEAVPIEQVDRTWVRFRNRKLSYFSGCDYFRLASHPAAVRAVRDGAQKYGVNVAASRLTTGNHKLYGELEESLARFFQASDALLVPTGYVTNLIVAQALAGNFSHVLIDAQAHPSLVDAARLFDCPVLIFKHRDEQDLAQAVRRCGPAARQIVLTDGMFSRDGSVAPLAEYVRVLPKDAWMLVDDAHGAGVLGPTGKGSPELEGVSRDRIVQTITLSKAFGAYGGAILGTAGLRKKIIQRSRIFVGSTPVPLPLANAALQGIRLLKTDPSFRRRLEENAAHVRAVCGGSAGHPSSGAATCEIRTLPDFLCTACNLDTAAPEGRRTPSGASGNAALGPIISLLPRSARHAAELSRSLLRAGIFPPLINYPGAPATGYFRFAISSEHTRKQLDELVHWLATSRVSAR